MNTNYQLMIVSDIHILSAQDIRVEWLIRCIETCDAKTLKAFVLLGDIFDFYLGTSPAHRDSYNRIFSALETLGQKGVEIHFVQGNHEFGMTCFSWPTIQVTPFLQDLILEIGDQKILLCHGDKLNPSPSHLRYSKLVNSPWIARAARWIPSRWLDTLALHISRKSRQTSSSLEISQQRLASTLWTWLHKNNCDIAVAGHYHMDFILEEESKQIACTPCWDTPAAIALEHGKLKRIPLKDWGLSG